MSTRLHFFILVLVLLTTLTFNGAAPQTQKLEKGHRVLANGATYGLKKRSGSSTRVLEENPGSRPQTNPDDPEDTKANSKPRVMGHGQFKSLRTQPSDVGEEDDIDGREVIVSKKIKPKPKRGYNPNRGLSPAPAPKV
ncbi:hypothetical protein L1987_23067 [Smallanthus sonchifolius]|uniref:Uncharacterized protein n=1 Tax=Smallanthus sonchifolius TaxID=185202 RepID=A0ACB9IFV2_9ASTR|nr:hypothetical protein L1987_23067 [Smallanthus sonchifolius]